MNKRLIWLAILSLAVAGCSHTGRMARVDPASVTAQIKDRSDCQFVSLYKGDQRHSIDLDCYKFNSGDSATAYKMASAPDGQRYRNRLQNVLLNQANFVCQLQKGRIYANRATLDSALDFTSAGFSSASTVVGGELAKSILSAVAGLSTATRGNLNSNVYQNQLVPAITRVMDAERKNILIDLSARSKQGVTDYDVDEMIRLVNEYHQACSFEKGVQLLLNAALNKEGVDAIIRDINLRANASALAGQIDQQLILKKRLDESGVDSGKVNATIDALQTQSEEIALKLAANRQSTETVTTPASPSSMKVEANEDDPKNN